jgi:hypothetical protein
MYLIPLRKKAPAKEAFYLIKNCLQLDQSAQAKGVHATIIEHEFVKLYLIAICSMTYQPIDY